MGLIPFSGVCLSTFVILQLWWVPRLRRAIREEPTPRILPRVAKLALLRYVRAVALVGLVTSMIVSAAVLVLRLESSPDVTDTGLQSALLRVNEAKQSLDALHPYWVATAGLLLAAGLGFHTYRRKYIQCSAAVRAANQAEFDRLVEVMNYDPSWYDLAPNQEMRDVWSEISALEQRLPSFNENQRPFVEQRIDQLKQVFFGIDVVRRMDVRLNSDDIEDPEPETWRDWLGGLLGSRRVIGTVGLGTRLLYYANLTLLMLGLIGFQSSSISQKLDDKLIDLRDLQVRLERLDRLEQQVAREEQETRSEPKQQSTPSRVSQVNPGRFSVQVKDLAHKSKELSAKLERAKSSRPSFEEIDASLRKTQADLDAVVVREKEYDDLIREIRRTTDEPPHGTQAKGSGDPATAERTGTGTDGSASRERIGAWREKLDSESADPTGRARHVQDQTKTLGQQLAETEPEAQLKPLREELQGIEKQVDGLRAARRTGEQALAKDLESISPLRQHEAELRDLRGRIDWLRAGTEKQIAGPAEQVRQAKARYEGELAQRRETFSPRSERVASIRDQTEALARSSVRKPAEIQASRVRLVAAEARLDWEAVRTVGDKAVPELTIEEIDAAKRIARAYEVTEGESYAARGVIPEADPVAAAKVRAIATRDAILRRAQQVAPTERLRPPTLGDAPKLSLSEKNVARSSQAVFETASPRTWVGKEMEGMLVREARTSPKLRQVLLDRARAVGQNLRSLPGRRFLGELALDALDAAGRPVLGDAATDLITQLSRDTLVQYERAARYRFIKALAGDGGVETALTRLRSFDPKVSLGGTTGDFIRRVSERAPSLQSVTNSLRPFEPAIDVPFEAGVKLDRASDLIRKQVAQAKTEMRPYRASQLSEALYNYSDPFPSQPGIDRLTPRGRIIESYEGTPGASLKAEADQLAEWAASGHQRTRIIDRVALKAPSSATLRAMESPELASGRLIARGPRPVINTRLESFATRARAFRSLISSPRVGGVLIGREPGMSSPGQAIDLTDLRWEVESQNVRMIVSSRDGVVHRSLSFRRDLAELALAYAADGRPIAVTIINSSPLAERRVLLHPALVDTALGRAVIQSDLIIFKLIQDLPWYKDAYDAVRNQVELYRRAWAIRQLVLKPLEVLTPEYLEELERTMHRGDRSLLTATLRDPAAIRDPARSPLTVKSAYFDQTLVDGVLSSTGPDRSLDQFDEAFRRVANDALKPSLAWMTSRQARKSELESAVQSFNTRAKSPHGFSSEATFQYERNQLNARIAAFDSQAKSETDRLNQILRRWTMPVPKIAHVSGIRERSFAPTLAECFVTDGAELPPMVEYLIQITFDTLPYFLKGEPPDFEDKAAHDTLAAYDDPKPWEFPSISGRVRDLVQSSLKNNPQMAEDRQAIVLLSEFTLLQRLFRLGLGGHLGRDFPVEALAELHLAVAPITPPVPVRTLRWDCHPGQLEQALGLVVGEKLTELGGKQRPGVDRIRKALRSISELTSSFASKVAERDKTLAGIERAGSRGAAWDAAWDAFQAWDQDWEAQLEKAVAELAKACERAEPVPAPAQKTGGAGPSNSADTFEAISEVVQYYANAIALRRALDLATDDKQIQMERSTGRPAPTVVGASRTG
jgi:hypothetical protein